MRLLCDVEGARAAAAVFGLPPVYRRFLERYSSHDFIDTGLRCDGVEALPCTVDTVVDAQATYAGMPRPWFVVAQESEAVYVIDRSSATEGDCNVLRHDFGGPYEAAVLVAGSFVEFIERIAQTSGAEVDASERDGDPTLLSMPNVARPMSSGREVLGCVMVVLFLVGIVVMIIRSGGP